MRNCLNDKSRLRHATLHPANCLNSKDCMCHGASVNNYQKKIKKKQKTKKTFQSILQSPPHVSPQPRPWPWWPPRIPCRRRRARCTRTSLGALRNGGSEQRTPRETPPGWRWWVSNGFRNPNPSKMQRKRGDGFNQGSSWRV